MSSIVNQKRERVFLVLAGTFLAAMTMLNVVGLTRFIAIGPLSLAIGVLPYPLTFLCTDLISELYGKKRANFVVWMGLFINVFVLFFMWLGQVLPGVELAAQPPWQVLNFSSPVFLPNGDTLQTQGELFQIIYACTTGSVFASMLAYVLAQFVDVRLFHWLKKMTDGKHLWLRNNGSTVISQLVDSVAVIGIVFGPSFLRGEKSLQVMLVLLGSNYAFKLVAALADTIPFYLLTGSLRRYLSLEAGEEVPD